MLGLTQADRPAHIDSFWEFLHPDDHELLKLSLQKHFEQHSPYDVEFRIRHGSGDYRWFRSRGFAFRDGDGTPVRMSGSIQDITERRLAEQKLRHLAAIIESSNDAIISKDVDGAILFWSRGAEQMYGYSADEMVGQRETMLLPPDRTSEAAELIGNLLEHGRVDSMETYRRRKDGKEVAVSISIAPVYDGRGRLTALASIHRDITEQKEARRALEEKDLQLRQKQKLEAVGSLAGGIAHEFNNLLHVISGYARLAIDGLAEEERRYEDICHVINAADRAASLTKRILQFSRREEVHKTAIDANHLVRDLVMLMRPIIGEQIDLSISLADPPPMIAGDRGLLEQMLLNLCVNARDAMPSGGTLTVRTQRLRFDVPLTSPYSQAPAGDYLLFSITDTGHGMTPEVQERLFEPFYTTKPIGSGTGLGLPMVYGVVRQHGGVVDVKSTPGIGSVFQVYLPIIECQEPESRSPGDYVCAANGDETILVAEDDTLVRDFAVRILSSAGYRVLAAADGAEAIRIFDECHDRIDLALLDIMMPKRNGRDVFDAIRALSPATKVVFSSGYSPEMGFGEFINGGELKLLQKPFEAAALLETIQDALKREVGCPTG